MKQLISLNKRLLATCVFIASTGISAPALAADPPDFTIVFPAGVACSNFDLSIDVFQGTGNTKELKDKNGYVRTLFAGKGAAFRYTNVLTGKSMSTKAGGGSQLTTTYLLDGSQTITSNGHVLLVLFPSDFPPGPSTSYHTGRVVLNLTAAGVGTVVSVSGRSTDICTELS